MRKQLLLAAAAMAITASMATAQLGRQTYNQDLETPTQANNGHLGCAYGLVNGFIYTTSRGLATSTAAPHTIYTWDPSNGSVTTMAQPAGSNATVWGYRDGASSILNQVFFGWDGGIDVYDADPVTGALTPATQLLAGIPTPLTQPAPGEPGLITSGTVGGTHRALAFNFYGNGGTGSFFTANFGSSIWEIDPAGNVINTFPNTASVIWSAYGLALDDKGDTDETNDTLWVNSAPNAGRLVEYSIDRVNQQLIPTGLEIERNQPGTAQGGLCLVPGGLDGRDCGFDLLGIDQGTPDAMTGYRVVQWDGLDPANEPQLLVGVDGGTLSTNLTEVYSTTATIDFNVTGGGTLGLPFFLFFDLAGAAPRPAGPIPGVGDVAWELSHPRLTGTLVGGYTAGVPTSFPNFLGVQPVGTEIEWQAFAIDVAAPTSACGKNLTFLGLPWSTTNLAGHIRETDPLPYLTLENFEGTTNGLGNYPAGWSDGGGTSQWTAHSGATGSGATGPDSGAFSGTQYMYTETSAPNTAATFIMNTRSYTAAELAGGQIAFQLSRVGATIGNLDVFMDDGINPPVLIANYAGASASGNDWDLEMVTLPSIPANATFQFSYTAGGNFTGDLGIDDVGTL